MLGGSLQYAYTVAPRYLPDAWMQGGERFPDGAQIFVVLREGKRPLGSSVVWSADPAVSFDGKRLLFAAKRSLDEPWQIWETAIKGGDPRMVTHCSTDCIRPLYLPDNQIVYTRLLLEKRSVIEATSIGPGSEGVRVLTFAPGLYLTNDVLRDGRILFEVARRGTVGMRRQLLTVYPDGTGVDALRKDTGHDRHDARQLISGDVLFQSDRCVKRLRPSDLVEGTLENDTGSCSVVAPIAEVDSGTWIVGMTESNESSQVWLALKKSGQRYTHILEKPRGKSAIQPVAIRQRTRPREFPSGLQATFRAAHILGLPSYEEPYRENTELAGWLRIYSIGEGDSSVALGDAAIAKDGSFFIEVPGDQPLRFELLDAHRNRIRTQEHWTWLRKGERRLCIGCHAGLENSPRNRLPEALRESRTPTRLTGQKALDK